MDDGKDQAGFASAQGRAEQAMTHEGTGSSAPLVPEAEPSQGLPGKLRMPVPQDPAGAA